VEREAQVLAYEQAKSRLERQVDRLSELRSTTGVYLAATAAVASFLGARSLETGSLEWLEVLALGALLLGVACGVFAMRPFPDHEHRATEGKPVAHVPVGAA